MKRKLEAETCLRTYVSRGKPRIVHSPTWPSRVG